MCLSFLLLFILLLSILLFKYSCVYIIHSVLKTSLSINTAGATHLRIFFKHLTKLYIVMMPPTASATSSNELFSRFY